MNRREALKKGALVGGAVLWITPVVQMVQMGPAYASDVSPGGTTSTTASTGTGSTSSSSGSGGCEVYCIWWAPTWHKKHKEHDDQERSGVWNVARGDGCMPKHRDSVGRLPDDIDDFDVEYDKVLRAYTVTYPKCYSLMHSGDPTPDELIDGSASISRKMAGSCRFRSVEHQKDGDEPGTMQVKFKNWDADSSDRIELVLKGCCGKGDRS